MNLLQTGWVQPRFGEEIDVRLPACPNLSVGQRYLKYPQILGEVAQSFSKQIRQDASKKKEGLLPNYDQVGFFVVPFSNKPQEQPMGRLISNYPTKPSFNDFQQAEAQQKKVFPIRLFKKGGAKIAKENKKKLRDFYTNWYKTHSADSTINLFC